MSSFVTRLVDHYGLLAIFILMLVESCGIPFPSEVIMPFAGFAASAGHISLGGAVLAGAFGNLAGSEVAYWLAARWGTPLLLGPGRHIGISAAHLDLAQRWFDRHGLWAVFGGRMLPVVRTYISFPAGLARVKAAPFALLTLLGALPWCALLAWAGYAVGQNYDRVSGPIEKAAIVIGLAVAAIVVWWFVRGRHTAQD